MDYKEKYTEAELLDIVNESHEEVFILGYYHPAGTALKELDPIAFDEIAQCFQEYNYICTYCDTEYDNEDEALECCKGDKE